MGYNSFADIKGISSYSLAVVASQHREITRNSDKIWPYSSSRSSKVIDLGVNRKLACDFLLVIDIWPYLLPFSRYWRLQLENGWYFHHALVWRPAPTISGWNLPRKNTG